MGAWGEGMMANDTALDAIAPYQNFKVDGLPPNLKAKNVIAGKASLLRALMRAGTRHGDEGILGLAEFFLNHGAAFDHEARKGVLAAIARELSPEALESWGGNERRVAALERFRDRLMGKLVDPNEVVQDNEGLISRINRAISGDQP